MAKIGEPQKNRGLCVAQRLKCSSHECQSEFWTQHMSARPWLGRACCNVMLTLDKVLVNLGYSASAEIATHIKGTSNCAPFTFVKRELLSLYVFRTWKTLFPYSISKLDHTY